jgi:hypothetical protein
MKIKKMSLQQYLRLSQAEIQCHLYQVRAYLVGFSCVASVYPAALNAV